MTRLQKKDKTFHMVVTALLFAMIIFLQYFGGTIKIGGTSFSFVLLPIVVGAVCLGPVTGAFLGFAFAAMTILSGITQQDLFTAMLLDHEPVFTVLVCLLKGILAGYIPGVIWKLLKEKNETLAIFLASASAPVVNTGIFISGGLLFFGDALSEAGYLDGTSLIYFLVIGCAGINFIAEFGVNIILTPAIRRIITAFQKTFK